MKKLTAKERNQKRDIAKKIMESKCIVYNDWLHELHENYIDEHLLDYMEGKEVNNQPIDRTSSVNEIEEEYNEGVVEND